MFPIFRTDVVPGSGMQIAVVGTGFFISQEGHFASVAHVFDGGTANTKYSFVGFLPNTVHPSQLLITEVARDDSNDIYIGKVELDIPEPLALGEALPDVGKTVCIAGYPLANISQTPQGAIEVGGVRRYFQPSFVLDMARMTSGLAPTTRTHDGFLVRDFGLYGMSGGPIFDVDALVVGIQGSVTQPRVSTNGTQSISVQNAMAIRTDLVKNLARANTIPIR